MERLEALDDGSHSRQGLLGHLLGVAGQRCFELVAQGRQLLQIARMGKPCTQTRFIIPLLTLGDADIPGRRVAFGLIAADQTFEGVEDGARAVKFPGEGGTAGESAFKADFRSAVRMQHEPEP